MSADLTQIYRAFAFNNAWANHRLLGACAALTQRDFVVERSGFFPSLQKLLNHIYVIDLFYVDALEGGTLGPRAWDNAVPCPELAELTIVQKAVDRRLIAFCKALTALNHIVRVNRGDRIQTERCDRVLMHLFQHQIHHRGRAHTLLAGTSTPPPQLDEFFLSDDKPLRTVDFSHLGWTEDQVWGSPAPDLGA